MISGIFTSNKLQKGLSDMLNGSYQVIIFRVKVLYIDPWPTRQSEMHLCKQAEEEAEASGRYERI